MLTRQCTNALAFTKLLLIHLGWMRIAYKWGSRLRCSIALSLHLRNSVCRAVLTHMTSAEEQRTTRPKRTPEAHMHAH